MKNNKFFPLVSVIMNCHNGEKYLKESIKSLIFQTYKNWELIFWDNNSLDNSKKIVKKFHEPYQCSEETLKKAHSENYIKNIKNK